jgi:hypothetical protein
MKVNYQGKTHEAVTQKDGRLTSKDGKVFLGFGEGNLVKGAVIVPESAPEKAAEGDVEPD